MKDSDKIARLQAEVEALKKQRKFGEAMAKMKEITAMRRARREDDDLMRKFESMDADNRRRFNMLILHILIMADLLEGSTDAAQQQFHRWGFADTKVYKDICLIQRTADRLAMIIHGSGYEDLQNAVNAAITELDKWTADYMLPKIAKVYDKYLGYTKQKKDGTDTK